MMRMPLNPVFFLIFSTLAINAGPLMASATSPLVFNKERRAEVRAALADAALDEDALQFEAQQDTMSNARDCLPFFVRQTAELRVLYHYCSPDALAEDSKPRQITENFSVPKELARRFNFWRRIYSLWAKDQYVLHSSQYPEIVLEILDASKVYKSDFLGREAKAEKYVKKIAGQHRIKYRSMLMELHRKRKQDPESLSPALKRIARLFKDIDDPGKYAKAARTLRFQRGQRDFIANGLTVGPKYLHAIEPIFEEQGVPKELSRLAYIESSFNLNAYSKVGASGVYQIMPATGRQYLRMQPGIDERNEPIKAAKAAAKLLRLNYNLLGSWPLAVTAYNHGVGGLMKAVRKTGTNDLTHLVAHYKGPQFQFASKNFFCGFLAILATLEQSEKLFPDVAIAQPENFEIVKLAKATSVKAAAKKYAVELTELLEMNRDIQRRYARNGGMLPRGYQLKLPVKVPKTLPVIVADTEANSSKNPGNSGGGDESKSH